MDIVRVFLICFALISVKLYEESLERSKLQLQQDRVRFVQTQIREAEKHEQELAAMKEEGDFRVIAVLQKIEYQAQKKGLTWSTVDRVSEPVRLEPASRKRKVGGA